MLVADHDAINAMLERLRTARLDPQRKGALVREICMAQRVHMMLEEEIVYPAVRRVLGEEARMEESQAQHDAIKPLLAQLASMRPGDIHFDASIAVLGEYIRLHVEQEYEEVFPRVRGSGLNLRALGEQMRARKRALMSATIVLGEVLTTGL
jgi:hemerythrin superfamily protein